MDFRDSPQEAAFRSEVRAFLQEHAPRDYVHAFAQNVDDAVLVTEDEVRATVARLARGNHMVVEPSGALALAVALAADERERGVAVALVTGGSIDPDLFAKILGSSRG